MQRVDLETVISVRHVIESRRLLKASIARVEHEDVDVFADDTLDDEIARQAEEAEAGMGGEAGERGGGGEGGGGTRAVDGAKRVKTIPYPKFKKIEQSLIVFLRANEPSPGVGLQQSDVVEWYLNQQVSTQRERREPISVHLLPAAPGPFYSHGVAISGLVRRRSPTWRSSRRIAASSAK